MQQKIQKITNLSQNVYAMSQMLKEYCAAHQEIEEILAITPLSKHLFDDSDNLLFNLINED